MKSLIIVIIVVRFVQSEVQNENRCAIWWDPPACYCEFCVDYENCLSECTRRLDNRAQIIKFHDGNFNKIKKTPTNLNCTNLKRITISSCRVEEVEDDFFHQFNVLDYVTLIDNNIKDQKAPLKLNLSNTVTTLELIHNSLQRFPQIISEKLAELDLSRNRLTYLDLRKLTILKTLKTLYLEGNKLADIDFVKPMPKILMLHLELNQFPCSCRFYQMFMDNLENIYIEKGLKCVNGTKTVDLIDRNYTRTLFRQECRRMPINNVSSTAKMSTTTPLTRLLDNINSTDLRQTNSTSRQLSKSTNFTKVLYALLSLFLVATLVVCLRLCYRRKKSQEIFEME